MNLLKTLGWFGFKCEYEDPLRCKGLIKEVFSGKDEED